MITSTAAHTLGMGSTGVVVTTSDPAHVHKRVKNLEDSGGVSAEVARELAVMAHFSAPDAGHPHILPCLDVAASHELAVLKLPRLQCSLWEMLHETKVDVLGGEVAHDISSALVKMHALAFTHGDVKTQNILFDGERFVLADFGLAAPRSPSAASGVLTTIWYRAPELLEAGTGVLQGDGRPGPHSDMWSMGCVLGEVVGKRAMFPGKSRAVTLRMIKQWLGTQHHPERLGTTRAVGEIILGCLQRNPAERHSAASVCMLAMAEGHATP